MANKNINDLPTATSLNAGDKLEILQGGTNKQIDSSLLVSQSTPLGLIQIIDLDGDFFTDLATASAYIRGHFSSDPGITNESFDNGVYYCTVPRGTIMNTGASFMNNNYATTASFIDEFGLIAGFYSSSTFYKSNGNHRLGKVIFSGYDFEEFSGTVEIAFLEDITYPFAENSTGKFIINGNIGAIPSGNSYAGFFLTSTATILVNKEQYTINAGAIQGDLQTAIANGCNVQFDGINLATVNDISGLAPLNSPIFTGTPLAPTPTISSNNTEIATTAFVRNIAQWVTLEMFGAVGNGSTNDQAALQNAINYVGSNSNVGIMLGYNKNYRVTSVSTIVSNVTIKGWGRGSIISTGGNVQIFDITGSNNTFDNITFLGATSGGSGAANYALFAAGNAGLTLYRTNNLVSNCYFENVYGAVYAGNMVGTSSGSLHEGAFSINNCVFTGCTYGIQFAARGEYNTVSNCKINGCINGIQMNGGNCNVIGGQITDCTTGIVFVSGTNNTHCTAVGLKINHCTTLISGAHSNNWVFTSCLLYVGSISLTSTGKTSFIGCEFSMSTFTLTVTNSPASFYNCEFVAVPTTYTLTGTPPVMNACYSGTSKMATPKVSYNELNTLAANGTFTVPAGMSIESIVYENTTANAVTGGVKIGTTNGGIEVVIAQAIGANGVGQINDVDILLKFFSSSAQQILYIQAVTAWNSASVKFYIKLKPLI